MQKRRKKNHADKWIAAGTALLILFLLLALLVPVFSPYGGLEQNADMQNQAMSPAHWFGTDKFGRDIFVRVCCGMRLSLLVGAAGAFLCGTIGIVCGGLSGYAGGWIDLVFMRIADILEAIPSLLYMILIMLVLKAGPGSVILGICVSGWTGTARLVRGEIMRWKEQEFCVAARLSGTGKFRILWKHLMPNAAGTAAVNVMFLVPKAIFAETFLSFVGVGIAAPAVSLGTMIQEARSQMQVYPYQMVCPMAALCALIFAVSLVGSGIGEKLEGRKHVSAGSE